MIHTLKTVGDLLELCKRLPEDMELAELSLKYNHKLLAMESCHSRELKITVERASVAEDNVVMKFLSSSLNVNWDSRR